MATISRAQMRFLYRSGSATRASRGGQEDPKILETASQTWKAGDMIYLDTNGKMAAATATSFIAGQAREAATGTTNSYVPFWPISPQDVFLMNVDGTTTDVTAQTNLGLVCGIQIVSNNVHVDLDIDEAGSDANAARVKIVGFWPDDAIGDTYGRVLVQFLENVSDTDGNPYKRILQYA